MASLANLDDSNNAVSDDLESWRGVLSNADCVGLEHSQHTSFAENEFSAES
jgi:hypothetical protein